MKRVPLPQFGEQMKATLSTTTTDKRKRRQGAPLILRITSPAASSLLEEVSWCFGQGLGGQIRHGGEFHSPAKFLSTCCFPRPCVVAPNFNERWIDRESGSPTTYADAASRHHNTIEPTPPNSCHPPNNDESSNAIQTNTDSSGNDGNSPQPEASRCNDDDV